MFLLQQDSGESIIPKRFTIDMAMTRQQFGHVRNVWSFCCCALSFVLQSSIPFSGLLSFDFDVAFSVVCSGLRGWGRFSFECACSWFACGHFHVVILEVCGCDVVFYCIVLNRVACCFGSNRAILIYGVWNDPSDEGSWREDERQFWISLNGIKSGPSSLLRWPLISFQDLNLGVCGECCDSLHCECMTFCYGNV